MESVAKCEICHIFVHNYMLQLQTLNPEELQKYVEMEKLKKPLKAKKIKETKVSEIVNLYSYFY